MSEHNAIHRLHVAALALSATLLVGCGLIGSSDKAAADSEPEESRLAQAFRVVDMLKGAMEGQTSSADSDAQGRRTGTASSNDMQTADGIAQEGRDLDEIMRRMKDSGDMSQAGEVMSRMMQMAEAMQGMGAASSEPQATAAGATQTPASDQMRDLNGIPVTSHLSPEQAWALFAPQAWGETP